MPDFCPGYMTTILNHLFLNSSPALDYFTIAVSNNTFKNTTNQTICYHKMKGTSANQPIHDFMCKQPVWGRYLFVYKPEGESKLEICEVQIYGGKLNMPACRLLSLKHDRFKSVLHHDVATLQRRRGGIVSRFWTCLDRKFLSITATIYLKILLLFFMSFLKIFKNANCCFKSLSVCPNKYFH